MKGITNKQAYFSFEILDKLEVGVVLHGYEVKSVKAGQISLKGSYVSIRSNPKPELFLIYWAHLLIPQILKISY